MLFSIEQLFAPKIAGGDFPPSGHVEPGYETKYIQIEAPDEGFDTFHPVGFEGYAGADTTGSWANWATRMHKVTLSLADSPMDDLSLLTHSDAIVTPRKLSVVPEITAIKAEKLSYTISKSEQI